jgi:hypothetical protein
MAIVVGLCASAAWAMADGPPAGPPLSTVVSADDLAGQIRRYGEELATHLETAESYKAAVEDVKKIANTEAMLAMVLAKHDSTSDLTPSAPAVVVAAQQLAKADGFEAAKQAQTQLAQALAGQAQPVALPSWSKLASQLEVMEASEDIFTRLRTSLKRMDPARRKQNMERAAVLVALGEASLYDTHEVKDPAQLPQWYTMCAELRTSAAELSAKIKAGDRMGVTDALKRVDKSCDDCHKVFTPEK